MPHIQRFRYSPEHPLKQVVNILILANVVIFILFANSGVSQAIGLNSNFTLRRFYTIITYSFMHGDFMHLLMNVWGLYIFGKLVESTIGKQNFLELFFFSVALGGASWVLVSKTPASLIGASGGVFGVVIAAAMLYPYQKIGLIFLPGFYFSLKNFAIAYLVIETLMATFNRGTNIAHIAHIGGAMGGYLYIMLYSEPVWSPFNFLTRGGSFSLRAWLNRRRFRVVGGRQKPEKTSSEEIDRILDKISEKGINSLTKAEKEKLENARNRLRDISKR